MAKDRYTKVVLTVIAIALVVIAAQPWLSGSGCSSGPLYKYDNYTRKYHQYGRKLSYNYTWYSCSWMSMPADCTTTCG